MGLELPWEVRIRCLLPGSYWFVTTRCLGACYRLRPDSVRSEAFGFYLGKALAAYPGIRLFAVVQMSNHFHLVLRDDNGDLADFMNRFESPLAKFINRLDSYRGPLYEDRYCPIRVLDEAAVLERIAYSIANPVAANLVAQPSQWPGVLGWFGDGRGPRLYTKRYADGRIESACIEFEAMTEDAGDLLRLLLQDKIKQAHLKAKGKPLGARRLMRQDPFASPEAPKRGRAPLCFASDPALASTYAAEVKRLEEVYDEVSARYRAGEVDVEFPPWTFRPWLAVRDSGVACFTAA